MSALLTQLCWGQRGTFVWLKQKLSSIRSLLAFNPKIVCHSMFRGVHIIISSFCFSSIKIYSASTPTHNGTLHTQLISNELRAQDEMFFFLSVLLSFCKWEKEEKSCSFCFSSSKIQFSLERAFQIAAGAVLTCFIYSSALFLFQSSCVPRTNGSLPRDTRHTRQKPAGSLLLGGSRETKFTFSPRPSIIRYHNLSMNIEELPFRNLSISPSWFRSRSAFNRFSTETSALCPLFLSSFRSLRNRTQKR